MLGAHAVYHSEGTWFIKFPKTGVIFVQRIPIHFCTECTPKLKRVPDF